ncbi:hypothetical protein [uncultured Tateyamaria sp.]|uniref:hypothetical protein n=1 Tax=uncultured Tateyamaria sp. TaxID=455651 RepID=UPI00262029CB|nr:hypothetical protein [uncultured Tateyamaria sp.]
MTLFRTVLIAMTAILALITVAAIAKEGLDLLTPYFSAIFALTWQGQFNTDFAFYLVLSGIWMAWRAGFSRGGIALGVLAPPLGMLFFAPYLIYLIAQTSGDVRKLMMGVHAEDARRG